MTEYKSFDTSKNKIEKNWNNTEKNLSESTRLKKQDIISSQTNFNPSGTIIPLINRQETIYTSLAPHIPGGLNEFIISDLTEDLLPFTKINRKFYREELDDGDDILFFRMETYTLTDVSWKYVDDRTMILQILSSINFFSNKTFMDLDLIIKNPNIYTPLPKFKL